MKKLPARLLAISYFAIWLLSVLIFRISKSGAWAMFYYIAFLFLLLPITSFVISFLIGWRNAYGRFKWLAPIIFGVMLMFCEYGTFRIANTIASRNINGLNFSLSLYGIAVSAVGLALGNGIKLIVKNRT